MITALSALENVVSKVLKPLEVKRMRKKVKNQCYDVFQKWHHWKEQETLISIVPFRMFVSYV